MKKKRSVKETIERTKKPRLEAAFAKYPGEEAFDAGLIRYPTASIIDWDLIGDKSNGRKYTAIHTHPYNPIFDSRKEIENSRFPSYADLRVFLQDDTQKAMVIASRNSITGKVQNYFVLRKTKQSPIFGSSNIAKDRGDGSARSFDEEELDALSTYGLTIHDHISGKATYSDFEEAVGKLAESFHLNYRLIDLKKSKLESSLAAASLTTFLVSLIFLSSNITGDTIAGLNIAMNNITGITLFLVSIITAVWMLRLK